MFTKKLKASFFKRPSTIVAPKLLGKILVHRTPETTYSGIIVEVEAYGGETDEASHACSGLRQRNKSMFESGGTFYVYFTYGAHFCCNVVTGKKGEGEAVLIRALEPLQGLDAMWLNRKLDSTKGKSETVQLCNGPGKLCQAFMISKDHDGVSLLEDEIFITEGLRVKPENIGTSPRVGISKATDLPWRFYITGNQYVSKR